MDRQSFFKRQLLHRIERSAFLIRCGANRNYILVAFEQSVGYDIQRIKGVKSMLFGGEGLFYALMSGPGKVWLQTTPFSRLANRIVSAAGGSKGQVRRGGGLLGDLLGGD